MTKPADSTPVESTSAATLDTPLLDYATPAPPFTLSGFVASLWHFSWHRPLPDLPILLGFWSAWSGFYFWLAVHLDRSDDALTGSSLLLGMVLIVVNFSGIRRLLRNGRRWQILPIVGVALVSIAVTGMFQFDECPHAKYVQILGKCIAYKGYACNNPRTTRPWWMR